MLIPKEIKSIISKLEKKGFEAFVVGGCVRDLFRKEGPIDWDITTSAKPEQIKKIFPDSFYENKFLTVTIKTKSKTESLKEVEATTYRSEAKYSDKRHPDEVKFAKTLKEDLNRRDFTVNAMALDGKGKVIDYFGGQEDLKKNIIKTVGNPEERFKEDALRLMRAVRFAVVLGWSIEEKTKEAIKKNSASLKVISQERVRDELMKIIMSDRAAEGMELLRELGLLKYIMPELEEGYKVGQNKHHIYECYEHNVRSLGYAAKNNFNKYVRMAALLHDIGKPRTKQGEGPDSTFYGHEIMGAKMTLQILD